MSEMVFLRKEHAGADSFGHTWESDGDVVQMPLEQARPLLAIDGAGFSVVEREAVTEPAAREPDPTEGGDGDGEPDGKSGAGDDAAAKPAPKRASRGAAAKPAG